MVVGACDNNQTLKGIVLKYHAKSVEGPSSTKYFIRLNVIILINHKQNH